MNVSCMMSEEDGWTIHDLKAIERTIRQEIVWKQFIEAIRVMELDYHEYATEQKSTKDHETALYFLKDLKFNSDFPEYQPILGNLS